MPEYETHELKPNDIPFASDGLDAPRYFVEYMRGTMVANDIVKLNFVENQLDVQDSSVVTATVVTLITPLSQVRAWAQYLNGIADQHGAPPLTVDEPTAPTQ